MISFENKKKQKERIVRKPFEKFFRFANFLTRHNNKHQMIYFWFKNAKFGPFSWNQFKIKTISAQT